MAALHAPLSPSARHRWQLCPASVREALKYPENKAGPAAIDGTHSHTLLEYCLNHALSPMDVIGTVIKDHEGEFTVDEARAKRVSVAIDYVRKRTVELDTFPHSEVRVDPQSLLLRDDLSGTVDVMLVGKNTLEIIDYKDGVSEVAVENNPQLRQYAVGAIAGLTYEQAAEIETVRMTIIQPKLSDWGRPAISSHEVPFHEFYLPEVAQLLREAVATDDPEAHYVPGEVQCRYCPHSSNCGARSHHALEQAGIKFGPTSVLEQAAEKDVKDLGDEQLRQIIEALPLIRGFLDSVEQTAIDRISSGKPIEGLKVVRGRGTRKWALPEGEIEVKLRKMQVPKSEIWVTKIISPAQAEKLSWTTKTGVNKTLSPKQKEILQSEMIQKSEGALTVVSAADERPAVEFGNLEQMFSPSEQHDVLPDWMK